MLSFSYKKIFSPIGALQLIANNTALIAILWDGDNIERITTGNAINHNDNNPVLEETEKQLAAYFNGQLKEFSLNLHLNGTPFQQKVWQALRRIPYGEKRSYAQIASQIGNPKAVRAVGMANSKNPIPIIVPCHRVIGANGTLTGYTGGLDKKTALLDIESGRTV